MNSLKEEKKLKYCAADKELIDSMTTSNIGSIFIAVIMSYWVNNKKKLLSHTLIKI